MDNGAEVLAPIIFLLFFGVVVVIGIAGFVLWLWALIDCASKEPTEASEKVIWILVIVLVPFGAILYLLIRRPQRIRQFGR